MVLGLVIEQDFIVDPSLYRRSLDAVGLVAEARFVASSLGRIIGYRPLMLSVQQLLESDGSNVVD